MKSVVIVDQGDVPAAVYQRLEQDGWICGRVADLSSAMLLLHQIRPAIVLVGSVDDRRDGRVLRALDQDPFMAGVPLVVLGSAAAGSGEIGGLTARLDSLMAAPR